ncbi:hypothetical protein SUGI_0290330 [Cryptomeria japonica]|nr:hypothetical protein SUGI_0290330 [Cryptomeria japonica]
MRAEWRVPVNARAFREEFKKSYNEADPKAKVMVANELEARHGKGEVISKLFHFAGLYHPQLYSASAFRVGCCLIRLFW